MNSGEVNVHELAKELHCSDRQVQLFVQAGMPRIKHGQYSLAECKKWVQENGRRQNGSNTKLIRAARKNRAVIMEFRRILRPLPNRLAPRLLGKTQREISEILQNILHEAVSEFSYQKIGAMNAREIQG